MGLFALLLGVIVISLFGSLIAADRGLSAADRRTVALDASGAALIAQRELRIYEAVLSEFAAGRAPSPVTQSAPAPFAWAWIADSARVEEWPGTATVARPDTATVGALVRQVAVDGVPRVAVREVAPAQHAILLAVPARAASGTTRVAVGLLPGERLLAGVGGAPSRETTLTLRSGTRRIATLVRDSTRRVDYVGSAAIAYAGDAMQLDIAHTGSGGLLRTTLWLLGVIALVALTASLLRERRHALSLAGRTSELERLYQEVARSNRMKSEFLANVSHELRTPLNAVVGFVEMLREGVYGELTPRQALPVDRIAASATHLRHLVDRLLDIAKIAAGRLEVHPEPLVLRPFVLNVASEMESLVSERGLALSIGVSATLPRIRTDQTHLRQILINLIGNAVKYTAAGSITIDARVFGTAAGAHPAPEATPEIGAPPDRGRPWIALLVTDTGVGIAPADTERIFDEFEQVNAGARTDSARRGTGLGLAISRRLARLLGGDLTVVSELGRGSTFTVWLPVDAGEPRPESA
jgi:signal transduction histidine kinase